MYILFEEHSYERHLVKDILKSIYDLQDVEKKVNIPFVGYFYNPYLHDCVFILPKVLMREKEIEVEEKKVKIDIVANVSSLIDKSHVRPEDIITREGQEKHLDDKYRKFIYEFSVWIYRALKVFYNANPKSQTILYKQLPQAGKGRRHRMETYLDIVLSLIKFNQENRDFILFTVKNLHRGNNKINWTRTLSHSQAFVQDDKVVYLNPVNKKRVVNFEEELFIIFFSILHYLNEEYGFHTPINIQYELIIGKQFQQYRNGMGKNRLRQIKYKYFSDKTLQLWDLCYAFFENTYRIAIDTNAQEYILSKCFNIVFEAMIDELVGDNPLPDGMDKKQEDGKIVDHLFTAKSLIENNESRKIYYIGDSKYYKIGHELDEESIYKQYTYARNVIQWNIDIKNGVNKDVRTSEINLRDDLTEGYNIIPNFFLSAKVNNEFNYAVDDIDKTNRKKNKHKKVHFENRLFDRNTLLLSHYDVNFLFVLSLYARNSTALKLNWKRHVREKFYSELRKWLQEDYEFYLLKPLASISLEEAVERLFRLLNGKIYKLGEEDVFLILALEKEAKYLFENVPLFSRIKKFFQIYDYSLITYSEKKKEAILYPKKDIPLPMAAESDEAGKIYRENAEKLSKYKKGKQNTILFGIYKDDDHLKWILKEKKYNVRFGDRVGAVRPTRQVTSAKYLVLYEFRKEEKYTVYELSDKHEICDSEKMRETGYPLTKGDTNNQYYLYNINGETSELCDIDVAATLEIPRELIRNYTKNEDDVLGTPIYVYESEIQKKP